jgi:hypothetical protein
MAGRKLDPIHPGEVLLHDFLEPWNCLSTDSLTTSACRRGASTRSYTARGPSRPTLRCVSRVTLAPLIGFGSTSKPATIWM